MIALVKALLSNCTLYRGSLLNLSKPFDVLVHAGR